MDSTNHKDMPRGIWVFVGPFASDCTNVQLSEFLCAHGITVGPDRVQVAPRRDGKLSGIVSVPSDVLLDLFHWAINGDKLNGYALNPHVTGADHKPR